MSFYIIWLKLLLLWFATTFKRGWAVPLFFFFFWFVFLSLCVLTKNEFGWLTLSSVTGRVACAVMMSEMTIQRPFSSPPRTGECYHRHFGGKKKPKPWRTLHFNNNALCPANHRYIHLKEYSNFIIFLFFRTCHVFNVFFFTSAVTDWSNHQTRPFLFQTWFSKTVYCIRSKDAR